MKKQNNIAVCRRIVEEKTARKIDGVLVDLFSARAIITVYDAVDEERKELLHKLDIIKLATVCMKCVSIR